jgi:hypothetical protein
MTKYFKVTKKLPSEVVKLSHHEVSNDVLERHLSNKAGSTTFSVKLPGLPDNSLGYVFLVCTKNNLHTVKDIKNVVHFRNIDTCKLVKIMKHASGIEFDVKVQSEFHKIRNEKGID